MSVEIYFDIFLILDFSFLKIWDVIYSARKFLCVESTIVELREMFTRICDHTSFSLLLPDRKAR